MFSELCHGSKKGPSLAKPWPWPPLGKILGRAHLELAPYKAPLRALWGSWLPWESNWEPREGPSLGIQLGTQAYQKGYF